MVAAREIYGSTSTGTSSTTSSTPVQIHSLTFTPQNNNSTVAIFWSCNRWNTSGSYYQGIRIRWVSSGGQIVQEEILANRDTTDVYSSGGMIILTGLSNVSATTIAMDMYSVSGVTASVSHKRLSAVVLTAGDYYVQNWSSFALTTSYSSRASITVPAGNWAFYASSNLVCNQDFVNSSYYRIHNRCTLGGSVYGYRSQDHHRYNDNVDTYNYQMAQSLPSGGTFEYQAGRDIYGSFNVKNVNLLALRLDNWPTAFIQHQEQSVYTQSTAATSPMYSAFSLTKSQTCFVSMVAHMMYTSTSYSGIGRFVVNGAVQTQHSSWEPMAGSSNWSDSGAKQCLTFNGTYTLNAGTNDAYFQHWSEIGTAAARSGRISTLVLGVEAGFNWFVRNAGTWKETQIFWVRNAGTWKQAQEIYVRNAGTWKPVIKAGDGIIGGNYQWAVSEETANPQSSPPPPPPPPINPPSPPSCVSIGTLITMWDGTKKVVEDILVGDRVITRNGVITTVTDVDRVPLGTYRRMMKLYHAGQNGGYLRVSDDHDLWTKIDDVETWGTYNYNWWLYENECYPDDGIFAVPLMGMKTHQHATEYGWTETKPDYELNQDPNEIIYGLQLENGDGYFADGFYVMAMNDGPK